MNALQRLIQMGMDNSDARQIVAYLEVLPSAAHREEFLLGCVAILIQSNAELRETVSDSYAALPPEQIAEVQTQVSGLTDEMVGK